MKSLTIIIPNYNGALILPENLPIILEYSKKYNATIIVVDDASTDASLKVLSQMPQIHTHEQVVTPNSRPEIQIKPDKINLIKKQTNQGFSSTVNIGVHYAHTELVCLLNSDVIPSINFLDPVLPHFDNPKTFAVGMKDLSDDQAEHGRGKFIFHRGFLLHERLETADKSLETGKTGWVSCGSGVFVKKIWDELGGLDELLNPFYFEDVDLGYRAWKSGYELYFEAESIVEHVHKKGAIKSNYQEQRIKTISYRNQFFFTLKNLTDTTLLAKHFLYQPFNLAVALKNNDKPYLNAYKEVLTRQKEIRQSRKEYTKGFTITDTEVFEKVNQQ